MRKFIIAATLITILLATMLVSAGVALADKGPYRPGDLLFPFQRFAEEQRPLLISSQTGRADYYLRLLKRRIEDLHLITGKPTEQATLEELNQTLDQATTAISAAPEADQPALRKRLADLIVGLRVVLANLQVVPAQSPDLYNNMLAKITTLESLIAGGQPLVQNQLNPSSKVPVLAPTAVGGSQSSSTSNSVDAHSVQFPPGSVGAEHAFFPLVGKHAGLACESCHANGRFAGTPNTCVACHAQDKPAVHFVGDCAACHTAVSWQDIHFNHQVAGATDCVSCHTKDKPANHFSGQCSNCHNTSSWSGATFSHQGATNCQSCHNPPSNHWSGQCSQCHNTNDWNSINVSGHSFPMNHGNAGGKCSSCHSGTSTSVNCYKCHNQAETEQHHAEKNITDIAGKCLNCHPTGRGD